MKRKKLLVVTRHSPLPENDGAGAYLFDLLSFLSRQGVEIRVVWVLAEGKFVTRGWWTVPRRFSSVARLDIIGSLAIGPWRIFRWGSDKARLLSAIKSFLIATGVWRVLKKQRRADDAAGSAPDQVVFANRAAPPRSWSSTPTGLEEAFFREQCARFEPDAVLANYCWMAPLLRDLDAQKLVLTHDVASHRLNLKGPAKADASASTPEREAALLEVADHILAISADDAEVFRGMLPDHEVLTVPKAASVQPVSTAEVKGRVLFVGGVNEPNREGLEWFLKSVWPTVKQNAPGAVLHVCGGVCSMLKFALPEGVILKGRVDDLSAEYGEAQVVVVPLLHGTGVKIKLVECCSFGRPCVTTPVGLQGLSFLRNSVIEAEDASAFAANVLRVLEDPVLRNELRDRSIAGVQKNLSPDHCYSGVLAALTDSPEATVPLAPKLEVAP